MHYPLRAFSAFLALLFVGCVGPQTRTRSFSVAGGKVVRLQVGAGGAVASQTADVKIEVTGFIVDGHNAELTYAFGLVEKHRRAPRTVIVEDVTGTTATRLVEDRAPALDSAGYWKGESSPRRAGDPAIQWLSTPGDTEKVFKFTLTLADGRTEEIYQASIWDGQMKPILRQTLKIDPAPPRP